MINPRHMHKATKPPLDLDLDLEAGLGVGVGVSIGTFGTVSII
jgi:hypothetical protein